MIASILLLILGAIVGYLTCKAKCPCGKSDEIDPSEIDAYIQEAVEDFGQSQGRMIAAFLANSSKKTLAGVKKDMKKEGYEVSFSEDKTDVYVKTIGTDA